jgi:hypothetical protein
LEPCHNNTHPLDMKTTTKPYVISVTCYNRPEHLDRLLASISAADSHDNWTIAICIEPCEKLADINVVLSKYSSSLTIISRVNDVRKGVRQNPFDCVEWSIANGAKTILLLEDDLIIDHFALRWCEEISAGALKAPNTMCANLLMTTCNSESIYTPAPSEWPQLSPIVLRTRFFSSIGLLFSDLQWEQYFKNNWFVDVPNMENWIGNYVFGWDVAMNRLLLSSPKLEVLQSLVPRVTHDGADGTHTTADFQSRSFDNITIDINGHRPFDRLKVCHPIDDLGEICSYSARMFINLSRHLWTYQQKSLKIVHLLSGYDTHKPKKIELGSFKYMLLRGRRPRT